MRVVQLITQARGGPVDHAVDVAVELARLGHDSHLVGPAGDHMAATAAGGVRVHEVAIHSKTDVAGTRALARAVAGLRPDVLHCQDRRAGLAGRVLALATGTPTVYTLHGVPDPLAPLVPGNARITPASRRHRFDNLTLERLLARVPRSAVVTPCEALARYAREHVGIPAERVHAVANGVGPEWLAEPPGPTGQGEAGRARAVWLGVMQPVKRVPELVRAAAPVAGLDLVLVGDGPQWGRIEDAVTHCDVAARVELAGFRDDPAPLLRGADLMVLPSAAEACPMALLQAMACGLPVVASRVGGIPEMVRDGVDGVLVDSGDADGLTVALTALTDDPTRRRRLGANARQRVHERFTIGHCACGLLDVYEGVCA